MQNIRVFVVFHFYISKLCTCMCKEVIYMYVHFKYILHLCMYMNLRFFFKLILLIFMFIYQYHFYYANWTKLVNTTCSMYNYHIYVLVLHFILNTCIIIHVSMCIIYQINYFKKKIVGFYNTCIKNAVFTNVDITAG